MRFARVISASGCSNPRVDQLAEQGDLDVLQVDYSWPSTQRVDSLICDGYAKGFIQQLNSLHKTLYLDPILSLVTNAGGTNTLGCIEEVAEYLCEHDDSEMPITAIRGDNQLSQLEELMAGGLDLQDMKSGRRLHDLARPLLTAQVELGAGPMVMALNEGARIVIAGSYDLASPLLAASVSATALDWDNSNELAQLAYLSRQTEVIVERDSTSASPLVHSLLSIGDTRMPLAKSLPIDDDCVRHADVSYWVPNESDMQYPDEDACLNQIVGRPSTGNWVLNVDYVSAYVVEASWEIARGDQYQEEKTLPQQIVEDIGLADDPSLNVSVLESDDSNLLVRVSFQSSEILPCEVALAKVKNHLARVQQSSKARIAAPPELYGQIAQFRCEVPRDRIAVSVDTRPAREWR